MKIPDNVWLYLEREAKARHDLHKHQKSHRPLSQSRTKYEYEYELSGLCGEWCLSVETGLPMDWTRRPNGDGRKDAEFGSYTLDVKTGRGNAYNLLRETNKRHADILVLAECNLGSREVELLGWEFDEEMLKCPTKRFHERGPINHYKHRSKLKNITLLKDYLDMEYYGEEGS